MLATSVGHSAGKLRLNGSAFLWVPGIERAYDEPVRSFTFLARSVLSNISFRVVSPTRLMRGAAACTGLSTRIGGAGGTPAGGSEEADILVYNTIRPWDAVRAQVPTKNHGSCRP